MFYKGDVSVLNTDFSLQDRNILKHLYKGGNVFEPAIKSTSKSEFKGKGDTNREGSLVATITAKVVEVLPNSNLVLEARKELTINNEKQILVLSGLARPDDISSDNTIYSNKIADAQVYYLGDGVIQDKQGPGIPAGIQSEDDVHYFRAVAHRSDLGIQYVLADIEVGNDARQLAGFRLDHGQAGACFIQDQQRFQQRGIRADLGHFLMHAQGDRFILDLFQAPVQV